MKNKKPISQLQIEMDIALALAENLEASAEMFARQIKHTKQAIKEVSNNE